MDGIHPLRLNGEARKSSQIRKSLGDLEAGQSH